MCLSQIGDLKMSLEFVKFPSINKFEDHFNAKSSIYHTNNPQTWTLYGSPKLHGSNASIVFALGEMQIQSRNRILSIESDNLGFAAYANNPKIREFLEPRVQAIVNSFQESFEFQGLVDKLPKGEIIGGAIYGEWCGQGVQKSVGVSQVERFFAPFDVCALYKTKDEIIQLWLNTEFLDGFRNEELRILPVPELWVILLKTNDIDIIQTAIAEMQEITLQVENECPFARMEFDVSGIGEGVVWRTNDILNPVRIKVKGDKHKGSKETGTIIKPVNTIPMKTLEFVNRKIDVRRCEQAIEYLNEFGLEIDKTSTGKFIQWIVQDIIKEDLREAYELEIKPEDIKKVAPKIARECFERFLLTGNF